MMDINLTITLEGVINNLYLLSSEATEKYNFLYDKYAYDDNETIVDDAINYFRRTRKRKNTYKDLKEIDNILKMYTVEEFEDIIENRLM